MAYDFRYFRRSFDPLSRTWELDTVLDLCPGPPGVSQSLVCIKGEPEPRWILTTWLTDDEITDYHLRHRSQSPPPPPRIFIKALRHQRSSQLPLHLMTSVEDISLSCDQLGNIYFKPTEVDSQETQVKPTFQLNTDQPTFSTSTQLPTHSYSTEFPKLEQPGTYLKPKPVLSPTNGESFEQPQPQLSQPPPRPGTVNSSILLNPTKNSVSQRPPPLQIPSTPTPDPSTPKIPIPLLSPRTQPPPLPVSVLLFLLLNLLTQVPSQVSYLPPPTPPSTSPSHFLRRVVCT